MIWGSRLADFDPLIKILATPFKHETNIHVKIQVNWFLK